MDGILSEYEKTWYRLFRGQGANKEDAMAMAKRYNKITLNAANELGRQIDSEIVQLYMNKT